MIGARHYALHLHLEQAAEVLPQAKPAAAPKVLATHLEGLTLMNARAAPSGCHPVMHLLPRPSAVRLPGYDGIRWATASIPPSCAGRDGLRHRPSWELATVSWMTRRVRGPSRCNSSSPLRRCPDAITPREGQRRRVAGSGEHPCSHHRVVLDELGYLPTQASFGPDKAADVDRGRLSDQKRQITSGGGWFTGRRPGGRLVPRRQVFPQGAVVEDLGRRRTPTTGIGLSCTAEHRQRSTRLRAYNRRALMSKGRLLAQVTVLDGLIDLFRASGESARDLSDCLTQYPFTARKISVAVPAPRPG